MIQDVDAISPLKFYNIIKFFLKVTYHVVKRLCHTAQTNVTANDSKEFGISFSVLCFVQMLEKTFVNARVFINQRR